MTPADPLEALRTGDGPVEPDPAFAADLRARLERALLAPEETPMTSTVDDRASTLVDLHALTPILRVADARAAVAFYVAAFGATRRDEPLVLPDGRFAHVEVALGDSVLMLADDNPPLGLLSPARGGGTGHTLRLETPDPDGMVATAVEAGATLERPVADEPYGRAGTVVDPDGHRWMVIRDPVRPAPIGDPARTDLGRVDVGRTGSGGITAYLAVLDARVSVEFYVAALGATRRGEPIVMPDGRIGHVDVTLGGSVLMLADEFPELGLLAPVNRGGPTQSLRLETADPDALVAAAVAHGARLERPVADSPYGRGGVVVDQDGHRWMISREAPTARAGHVVYASLWAPEQDRTIAFYSRVLGWDAAAGHVPHRGIGTAPSDRTTLFCLYRVPDLAEASTLVRAAGGTAGEPADEPWGPTARCADDQGVPFAVTSGAAPPLPGGAGSLGYAELRVPDAGRARAFYATVLGWRFTPGGDEGHWHVLDTAPMIGLHGGHEDASMVPWFRVDDLSAAVAAVRAAGGRADGPTGRGAEVACVDDRGTPFTLVTR